MYQGILRGKSSKDFPHIMKVSMERRDNYGER